MELKRISLAVLLATSAGLAAANEAASGPLETVTIIGRKEDAIRAGVKGVDLLPISKEAWRGAYRVEDLAVIYAMVGESDLAIDHLETLLSIPGDLSVNLLKLDPKWDPLRDHPRFIALLEKFAI